MIHVGYLNFTYQDIFTTFVLNTMLHHVGMLWIFETHDQLNYNMCKINPEWMTGGPWYYNYMEMCLSDLLEMKDLTYIISCVLLMHMKKSINNIVIMEAAVGVVHYHQIQQQNQYIFSVQPQI